MGKFRQVIRRVSLLLPCLLILISLQSGVFAAGGQGLSTEAQNKFLAQTKVLKAQKEAMTPVQRKVNTKIIRYLHTKVLRDQVETLPKLQTQIRLTNKNEILTDIKADVTPSLLKHITDNGGTIINKFPQYHAIRALIPITAVETIAAHPDVQFIDMAAEAMTNKVNTSEGYAAHNVPVAATKGYTGNGIKVGVLSDSADYLAAVQATGDLPAGVTVLQNAPGNSGEGTAMMEIVYDLAPAAPLYFATAWLGKASFASNIIALKDAGCKVIVDDVSYSDESPFQDDVISQAVSTVTDAGVLYFSSAGNQGNVNHNTSGTWEGDYVAGGPYSGAGNAHAFVPSVVTNRINCNPYWITLFWSDPLGASSNDYDLYVCDGAGNVIDYSTNPQTGAQDPYEYILVDVLGYNYVGYYIVIDKHAGAGRFLHLAACGGRTQYATNGETKGHQTVESAFAVSAVSAFHKTTPFTGAEALETFTSDGPRRVFYYPDGTPITPGNFSSTGGKVRVKPDITAADGVACATPGFNPFYGTSAAAPHAAAIAALLLDANPHLSINLIRNMITKSALPSPAAWNEVAGYGIMMADRGLRRLLGARTVPIRQLLAN